MIYYCFFLHNVKFYGCEEPKAPAFESDLTTNEGFYEKTGFGLDDVVQLWADASVLSTAEVGLS